MCNTWKWITLDDVVILLEHQINKVEYLQFYTVVVKKMQSNSYRSNKKEKFS
jgi:hypothetical protein